METDYMEKIKDNVNFTKTNIVFAPHHGRKSGKIPQSILDKINPDLILIGEAPSEDINYYSSYNTITQNTAGDVTFDCIDNKVHIYVGNENYTVDFLSDEKQNKFKNYIGTLKL